VAGGVDVVHIIKVKKFKIDLMEKHYSKISFSKHFLSNFISTVLSSEEELAVNKTGPLLKAYILANEKHFAEGAKNVTVKQEDVHPIGRLTFFHL
jgi:hypothetical protein